MEEGKEYEGEAVRMLNYNEVPLDDALSMTGYGKFHYILVFISGISILGMSIELYVTSYLLPAAQCDFQMTSEEKGLLNTTAYIGILASCHMWGCIADLKGRKNCLVWSLGLDFVCAVASCFAPNFYSFVTIRFFNGFFVFCAGAVVYAYTGEFHGPSTRSSSMIILFLFQALGVTILSALAWLIIPQKWSIRLPAYSFNSWRMLVLLCGLPSLLSCVGIYFFLPESPKFLLSKGRLKETLIILRRMYVLNSGKRSETYGVYTLQQEYVMSNEPENLSGSIKEDSITGVIRDAWNNTVMIFKKPFLQITLLVCTIQFGIFCCYNSILLRLPDIFHQMAEYAMNNDGNHSTICQSLNWYVNSNVSDMDSQNRIKTESFPDSSNNSDLFNGNYSDVMRSKECFVNVDAMVFRNNIIVSSTAMVLACISTYLIKFGKKSFMCLFLFASIACGISLCYVTNMNAVLALYTFFVDLTALASAFINAFIAELFPTNLRATAMCLGIMCGRMGTIFGNMLIALLLDVSCVSVFYVLSFVVFICACLSCLLPSTQRTVK